MASVDFRKCKAGSGDAGALLRHCDARERLKHGHSNEHIDKALTPLNRQGARSYEQTMAALRDRLAELDARPGANVRKDRVECFMLEAPIPAGVRNAEAFADMVVREISAFSGPQNVLNWYLHRDERHDYVDHGKVKTSLDHVHVAVVPEVGGRLNGKAFSSRERMIDLNKRIDERAREMGEPAFLAGTHPRKRSVEELKIASYNEALIARDRVRSETKVAETQLTALTGKIEALEGHVLQADEVDRKAAAYKRTLGGYVKVPEQEFKDLLATAALVDRAQGVIDQADEIIDRAQTRADQMLRQSSIEIRHYAEEAQKQVEQFKAFVEQARPAPLLKKRPKSKDLDDWLR